MNTKKSIEVDGDSSRGDDTDTIRLPVKEFEMKSIPVVCPWCNRIMRITNWKVGKNSRTAPSHGICPKCAERMRNRSVSGKEQGSDRNFDLFILI